MFLSYISWISTAKRSAPQSSYCHPFGVRHPFPVTQLIICAHGPDTWGPALYGTLPSWGGGAAVSADCMQKDETGARTPDCCLSPRIAYPLSYVGFITAPQHSWPPLPCLTEEPTGGQGYAELPKP